MRAILSPYFSAEVLQISGTVFHSSETTPSLPESNELSNKGENLLIYNRETVWDKNSFYRIEWKMKMKMKIHIDECTVM